MGVCVNDPTGVTPPRGVRTPLSSPCVVCPIRPLIRPALYQNQYTTEVSKALPDCRSPQRQRERTYAGSPNMKVERISTLFKCLLCTAQRCEASLFTSSR